MLLRCEKKQPGPKTPRRRGMVLLAVLIVVAILMLVAYQFHNLMSAEHEAVHASNRVAHGRYVADSGLHYAAFVLSYPQSVGLNDAEGSVLVSPIAIYHNPSVFQRRPVNAVLPRYQGYFSIVAPRDPEDPVAGSQPLRFGVEDESGKINLNALLQLDSTGNRAREMLQKLPNMTEESANALLNWVRASAVDESANGDMLYYSSLGYQTKYGPFESAEELLLVRGITPRMLFGNDLNRNGVLDADESSGGFGYGLDRGLSRLLTVYSREQNIDSTGQPRIFVNDSNLQTLYDSLNTALGESLANFIVGYKLHGQSEDSASGGGGSGSGSGSGSGGGSGGGGGGGSGGGRGGPRQAGGGGGGPGGGAGGGGGGSGRGGNSGGGNGGGNNDIQDGTLTRDDLDLTATSSTSIGSLYELINAEFTITKDNKTTRYRSPLQTEDVSSLRDLLPEVLDKLTTSQASELPAGININTAPREVLLTLPDVTEEDVQNILDHRPTADTDPALGYLYRTPAWLLTEAGFQQDVVQRLAPYITTRSFVFRVQVIGYYEMGGPVVRLEAVIDTTGGRPRFLHWRDLSELGRGIDPRVLQTLGP